MTPTKADAEVMTLEPEALELCPFCGSDAELVENPFYGDKSMSQCRSCGVSLFAPKWNRRTSTGGSGEVARYGAALNGWLESMEHAGSWDAATLKRLRENIGPILEEMVALSPSSPAVRDGVVCDCCGNPIVYDLLVPDELWAKIAPSPVEGWKGGGVLCPDCILSRALSNTKAGK